MLETSESIGELAASLAKAQGAMRAALKDSVNPHFRSRYADLAGVWDACREPLSANGLAVVQSPGDVGERTITVTTMLVHTSGEWMRGRLTIPVSKPDAQGVGSAVTYARRYALAAMVGIVQDDDDGNAASEPAPAKKAAPKSAPKAAPAQASAPAREQEPEEEAAFRVEHAIEAIMKAESMDDLKAIYTNCYNVADELGDDAAIEAIVRAKDARKAALGTKTRTPSRTRDAMKKFTQAPPPEAPAPAADGPGEEVPFGEDEAR